MAQERLDKLLASTGHWSRKEGKELIRQGRVQAGGRIIHRPEEKWDPIQGEILVDNTPISCTSFVYVMLHKPAGVLSATQDKRQKTVLHLLPDYLQRRGLFPVGRLDKDTEGLLLLTDDGLLGHELLSPKKHVDKTYYARVDGILTQEDVKAVKEGLVLEDGLHCLPAHLELLDEGTSCHITIQEGKYHQVKRMLASRGAPVTYLKRLSMGPIWLDSELEPGKWRFLTEEECQVLGRIRKE